MLVTTLLASFSIGDRGYGAARIFIDDLKGALGQPYPTEPAMVTSRTAIDETFDDDDDDVDIDYGQPVKLYGVPPDETFTERRHSPDECIGIKKAKMHCNPDPAPHVSKASSLRFQQVLNACACLLARSASDRE